MGVLCEGSRNMDQMGWFSRPPIADVCFLCWAVIKQINKQKGSEIGGFEPWSSQTNDVQMYSCGFLYCYLDIQ